ncbi:hypothetical protein Y032_0162g3433 [Ancylostoma ceylanicum]|uniref:Uncharacterized protein n=1 Tax=Ancylostoma ceylanicum TaxID=53326 RepID=A0A016SXN6_9BILA|nr:hypothetical protein Y032_0162g3433 [Ancylostoma ceylanicum]
MKAVATIKQVFVCIMASTSNFQMRSETCIQGSKYCSSPFHTRFIGKVSADIPIALQFPTLTLCDVCLTISSHESDYTLPFVGKQRSFRPVNLELCRRATQIFTSYIL